MCDPDDVKKLKLENSHNQKNNTITGSQQTEDVCKFKQYKGKFCFKKKYQGYFIFFAWKTFNIFKLEKRANFDEGGGECDGVKCAVHCLFPLIIEQQC